MRTHELRIVKIPRQFVTCLVFRSFDGHLPRNFRVFLKVFGRQLSSPSNGRKPFLFEGTVSRDIFMHPC